MTCIVKKYKVFAALHEDTDKGWVWLRLEEKMGFRSRMTIRICNGKFSVYCEHRNFDANFVRVYDSSEETTSIYFGRDEQDHIRQKSIAKAEIEQRKAVDMEQLWDSIIIGGWYRRALGDLKTGGPQELKICKPRLSFWADLRAGCQHPEPGVRIATRVAILGTWLGAAAFLPALAEVEPLKSWLTTTICYPSFWALIVAGLFGVLCLFAGRGVKR
jgi:hypothetical protein